ncbi:hypothetical protein DUI87_11084 [Hirundo rustica rustica]|uniref:Uncharacterized protein n=1 Tax=Hirundo rustica rustica TaxID=333673 RepID=A0A3M0KL50_HIRRU|nr:hypothetical protein DUI87_11084 [Hirundo rustica rustica]
MLMQTLLAWKKISKSQHLSSAIEFQDENLNAEYKKNQFCKLSGSRGCGCGAEFLTQSADESVAGQHHCKPLSLYFRSHYPIVLHMFSPLAMDRAKDISGPPRDTCDIENTFSKGFVEDVDAQVRAMAREKTAQKKEIPRRGDCPGEEKKKQQALEQTFP